MRLDEQWSSEYDIWCQRDVTGEQYVCLWANGIHLKVRLDDGGKKKQRFLVLMRATGDCKKEYVDVFNGCREIEQRWHKLLFSLI